MKCDNINCLYNLEKVCTVNNIKIDDNGMCKSILLVIIPDDVLEKYKDNQTKMLLNKSDYID